MPSRTESPSAQLGQLLLRGWTMQAESCAECQVCTVGVHSREQQPKRHSPSRLGFAAGVGAFMISHSNVPALSYFMPKQHVVWRPCTARTVASLQEQFQLLEAI